MAVLWVGNYMYTAAYIKLYVKVFYLFMDAVSNWGCIVQLVN
jgi:hypothetical protein